MEWRKNPKALEGWGLGPGRRGAEKGHRQVDGADMPQKNDRRETDAT